MRILLLLISLSFVSFSQEIPTAFVGAKLITITGETIEEGTIVVYQGKIIDIGPRDEVKLPSHCTQHLVEGKVIMPGLIDTHSHIGGGWGADSSAPIQPEVRVMDSIDVRHPGFRRALAGGVTTVNIMSGSGHLLSGQTSYLKLRTTTPKTIRDFTIKDKFGNTAGGMKMANGTNSIKKFPFPGTRAKSAALVRLRFHQALDYQKKIKAAGEDKTKLPPRDLGLEALLEVLAGKRIVHHHTHRHDDIITVLRLKKEFGFRIVLHHVSEAWKVADEIAASNTPCSLIFLDSPGGKLEAVDIDWKNGKMLEKAGALVAIHSDDWITDSRLFLRSAAFAVRGGMSKKAALYAMTMAGAKMMDLEERIGSLEIGKEADLVILSGDPLSVYTHILETWVEGKQVFESERDALWANGGLGGGLSQKGKLCCYEN